MSAAVRLDGIAANPMGKAVDNGFRQLPRLVDPGAGELEGQQFPHILRLVEGQENNLAIDAGGVAPGRQPDVMCDRRRPVHTAPYILGKKLGPCLQGRRPQHRIRIPHNGEAGVADAVLGARLLLDRSQHDLGGTSVGLAAAHRADDAAHESIRHQHLPNGGGVGKIEIEGG